MPAVAAHYYFGKKVYKLLPKEIQNAVHKDMDAFNLGLQGPDLFFYYKPLGGNEVVELGHQIHQQPGNCIISAAITRLQVSFNESAFSYLLGYTCHFILDSGLHGTISAAAGEEKEHKLLEAEIDRQIIKRYFSPKPDKFKRYELVKINDMDWMDYIYPEIDISILKKCAKGFAFYMKLLHRRILISIGEKAMQRQGEFSSMTITKAANERYCLEARDLCSRLEVLAEAGADAVKEVYTCLSKGNYLSKTFEKNFL